MKNNYNLLGEKLSHSFSAIIHKAILSAFGDNDTYGLLECNKEDLKGLIEDGKKGLYKGFNVTIPYKIEIMKYLDFIDDKAKAIGSVNTIHFKDGKAYGYNTDYDGFLKELKYYKIDVKDKDAYILGTGGASLAINKVLADLGSKTTYVSRNKIGSRIISYDELKDKDIDIIVNTTPVGMYPHQGLSPIDEKTIKKAKTVIDIIFNPKQTELLRLADSNYNGLYMLIAQAVRAEEIWHQMKFNDNDEFYERVGMLIDEYLR